MEVSADLSVLLGTRECEGCLAGLPERLRAQDFHPASIFVIQVAESCPDNSPLSQEYRFRYGHRPQGIPVWRLIVNGETAQPLAAVAPAVAGCLPSETLWLGSAEIGFTEMGLGIPAVWRAEAAH